MINWIQLQKNSYSPYSKQPVSVVVRGKSGKYYAGMRIENISYPLTIPAIQAACCMCLSEEDVPEGILYEGEEPEDVKFWINEFDLQRIDPELMEEISVEDYSKNKLSSESDIYSHLKKLLPKSVCTLSSFPVSAILQTEHARYEGVNVEVSAWSKGLCAERVALCKAISAGEHAATLKEMHVTTKYGEVSSPCGACRQVILEHMPDHPVFLHHADGSKSEHRTVDLVPFHFTSTSLKKE